MELCRPASSSNTLSTRRKAWGGDGAGRGWRPLHWYPKEVGIPLSPFWTGEGVDRGEIGSFEPFPPSLRSLLNFCIRDKEIDNASLSLSRQASVPLTRNRKAGARRPSSLDCPGRRAEAAARLAASLAPQPLSHPAPNAHPCSFSRQFSQLSAAVQGARGIPKPVTAARRVTTASVTPRPRDQPAYATFQQPPPSVGKGSRGPST